MDRRGWVRGLLLAVASGVLSVALGAWQNPGQSDLDPWSDGAGAREFRGILAGGLASLLAWLLLQALQQHRRRAWGQPYLVQEVSADWDRPDKGVTAIARAAGEFYEDVRLVSGPAALDHRSWDLDEDAGRWDERVFDHLTAVRAVRGGRPARARSHAHHVRVVERRPDPGSPPAARGRRGAGAGRGAVQHGGAPGQVGARPRGEGGGYRPEAAGRSTGDLRRSTWSLARPWYQWTRRVPLTAQQ